MATLNQILRQILAVLLDPLSGLSPALVLAPITLLVTVPALWVFKVTSDQERLQAVKDQMMAGIFEIRLFNDDLRAILRAQFDVLRHNLTYIRYLAIPFLWLLVPFALLFGHLHFRYEYRGLEPGESALLTAELRPGAWEGDGRPPLELEAPASLEVASRGVWIPARGEMVWRLSPRQAGEYEVGVRFAERVFSKAVSASPGARLRSPVRPDTDLWEQLLYPAESPLPGDAPVQRIELEVPVADVNLLGLRMRWWVAFLVYMLVFGLLLKDRMGVTI